jgi:hypothetical protein
MPDGHFRRPKLLFFKKLCNFFCWITFFCLMSMSLKLTDKTVSYNMGGVNPPPPNSHGPAHTCRLLIVSVIVLFIIDVYMRLGWKKLRLVWSHSACCTKPTDFRPAWIQTGMNHMNVNTNTFQTGLGCNLDIGTTQANKSHLEKKIAWQEE